MGASGAAPASRTEVPATDAHLSRRAFLALGGGVVATGALGGLLGPASWERLLGAEAGAATRGPANATKKRLVLVTLYGGNDGLNTVIPYQDPAYAEARGTLAIDAATVLPLGEGFGLHPKLPRFKQLWDAKRLAIVEGVGFANPNYSHFQSMDIWQSANPTSPDTSGWLGRWLDATGADPLRAIALGPTVPVALAGRKVQAAAIAPGPLTLPGDAVEQALFASMARDAAASHEPTLLAEASASNADLLLVHEEIGSILNRTAGSDPLHLPDSSSSGLAGAKAGALAIANGGGGRSSANVLSTQLSIVANLILAGETSEVYSVELGGFDTHAAQADTQATLLSELDTAVGAFVDAVAASPQGRDTVVVIYTEFGRRVSSNASVGTDHGWANVVFAAGPTVKGGFYGDPPDLSRLSEGNLVFTTDFRSVYATVLAQVLGVDPKSFLGGSFKEISFV